MLIPIGIGTVIAVTVIAVVSYFTGGTVTQQNGQPTSALVGQKMADFHLPGLFSGKVSSPYSSGHPTVVMFFASFCTPCHKELPKVASFVSAYRGPVAFIGIDATDEQAAGRSFVSTSHVNFPVGFDANGSVTQGLFGFAQLPETVFLDSHGVVQQVYFGAIPVRDLRTGLTQLH